MKKIYSLFIMLALLCFSWAGRAQETLTVYEGTSTNGYVPVYGFYADAYLKAEFVIPASDLSQMSGGEIFSMKFYSSATNVSWGNASFEVFLTEIDETSLDQFVGDDGATVVYTGALSIVNGEMEVTFTTPYSYGGGNLLVGFYNTVTGSYVSSSWNGESVNGASVQGYSYSGLSSITPSQRNFIPKTTFTYDNNALCKTPKNLNVTDITTTSATISWTGDENAAYYNIQYMLASETDWENAESDITDGLTYDLYNLTHSTTYKFRVQTACSDDSETSWSSPKTFTTACEAITVTEDNPWFEGFEEYQGTGEQPFICWETPVSSSGGGPFVYCGYAESSHNSENSAELKGNSNMLVLPEFTNDIHELRLSFWATANFTSYGTLEIGVLVDMDDIDSFEPLCLSDRPSSRNGVGNYMGPYDFNSIQASSGRIALRYTNSYSSYSWNLDDFTVEISPACSSPVKNSLSSSDVDGHNATISWVDNDESHSPWTVYYKEDTETDTWQYETAYDTFYTLTDLTPETAYNVYVVSNCGSEPSEDATHTYTFTTTIACPAPTGLTAALTPGNGSIATLNWTESGSAENWIIEYGTSSDFSDANTETADGQPTISLTGLTPETTYYARVQADCGSYDGQSAWSSTISFTPTDAYNITLNNGETTNSYVPVYGLYVDAYSKSQFIIPASELTELQGGSITKLTFYAYTTSTNWTNAVFDVRLKEVDYTTFSTTTLEDWDGMSLTYTGSLGIANNIMTIVFTEPFVYEGGNLMIGINETTSGSYVSSSWYGVAQSENTAIGGYVSSYNSSYLNPYKFLPKVTIDFEPGASFCPKPADLTATEVGPHSAVLNWTQTGEASEWQLCINDDEDNLITVTENPYPLDNLEAETEYSVKLRANCGEEQSQWSTLTFTTTVACPAPTNLDAQVNGIIADLSWNGYANNYNLRFIPANEIPPFATITLVAGDVWQDGTGYQMLLDADADTYGTIIPTSGGLTSSGDAPTDVYDEFEYKIPVNADGELTTTNIILDNSATITVPAGTYDWCITNPTPGDRMWIAASGGSIEGRYDDFVFEAGMNYVFVVSLGSGNDQVDLSVNLNEDIDINWVTVHDVPNPFALQSLLSETEYIWQVQADCGSDGQSAWSSLGHFTTGEVSCLPPSDLVYYALTYNSVVLDWSELNADGNAWEICINGDEENLIPASNNHDFLLSNLTPNTEYTVKVRTICGTDAYSEWGPETTFTTEACPVPANPTVSDVTKYTALLMWDGTVMGWYQICLNGDEDHLIESGTTSYNLNDLLPGTDYTVKVRSICGEDSYSDWSVEVPFTTEPCTVPTSLTATGITKNTAILDWAENGDATAWQIMVNNDEENLINVIEHPYTLTDLNPETEYTVSVRSICIEGIYSEWSIAANFITDLACHAPTELTVNDITSGDAILTWQGEGLTYNIRYRTTDDEWMEINEEVAPYTLTGLQPGTNYDVQVQANCGEGVISLWSDIVSFSTLECPAPTALIVSDITKNSALLSWSENGDATVWQLALNGNEDAPYPVTANPFTIPGLEPETEYTVKLRAVCGGGAVSEWSEEVTFTTDLACHAPTDLTVSDITSGDAVLTWLGEGINYILQYKMASEEDWYQVDGINTPYTLGGLQPDIAYEVRLKANCDSYGTSLWTEIVSFSTAPCPAPTSVTVSNITQNNATVSWTESGDASAWQICFNGDEENLINVTTIPYTLTGMNPETEYTVKVRANCGGGASSEWSELVTFTTQMASVVPTILTVTGELSICPGGSTVLSATSDVIGTYTWSTTEVGQQITATAAGSYSVTVTTATGDWLADTVYVVEKESYEINVEKAICYNELPYTWNNVVFTAAGGETVTLEAENGCDSVVHMNLIVNPIYTTPLTASICEGESYDFLGELLTEAGFYIDTIPTVNGCDSIITLDLTVNPLPIVTISGETSFCQDGSTTLTAEGAITYEWSNEDNTAATIITAADTYTVTGTDANNCSSTAEVTVTMKLPVNTPIAEAICEGQTYIFFDEELTESGEYTHTLTAANGCDSVITLTLTVNELPNVTISGDNEFCQGESTTLTATGAETYVWSTEATTAAINVNEAGIYTVIGTDANNCYNTAEVTVIMNLPASTPLTAAICEGESYTFFGEDLTEAGEYTHTLETVHGCDSVITLTLTVNALPTVTISGDNEFCQGESTTLTATGAVSYVWSTTATTAAINVDEAETYTVTGTDANNCSNTATVTVTMNMPSTGIDVQVACDSYIWIDGQTYTASTNTPTFTLTNAVGCDSVVTLNLTINNSVATPISATICQGESYEFFGQVLTTAGEYTHTLQAANGCDSVITLTLAVNPTFNTPVPATICEGEVYEFFGQELSTAGIYTHTLQAITGCDSVITLTLTINPTFNTPLTETICEGSSYDFFGQELTTAGEYTHTLQAVTGCDSVITLTLTVNPITTGIDEQTACDSYTWIDGQTYTTSTNTPTYTLTNAMGCDSVVTLHLTINNSVTTEFTIETNEGCYTWNGTEYCQSGDYTQNLQTVAGCDSVVTLHLTVGVGIENHEVTIAYLTPNPATNTCRIVGLDTDPVSVDLYDMNGKLVRRPNTTEFDVSTLPTGIYMVRIYTGERIINLKMVKQ